MPDQSDTHANELNYVPAKPIRAFRKGDIVEKLNRNGEVVSVVRVTYASSKVVHTSCGRRWDQRGWWFPDEHAWPFPSIRLKDKSSA